MAEHEDDDTYAASDLQVPTKAFATANDYLAQEALADALSKKARDLINRGSSVIVIEVPAAEWVDPISSAVAKLGKMVVTRAADEQTTTNKVSTPVGAEYLRHLHRGKCVAFISQDPATILDPAVHAAADITLKVKPATTQLLRKVIRSVTGGVARGVTEEMAQLPWGSIIHAIRPGLAARECVTNLKRSITPPADEPLPLVPLLTDLPLTSDLRRWADTTLSDLAAVSKGTLDPSALVYGVLEGKPGTGKTLMAQSLACTAGWNFVSSSVGQWFTSKDGALGGVARNLKEFIDTAIESAPCVAFLDELDGLPDRSSLDDRSRDWWAPVVNLALTEIDRLRSAGKEILLLGSANYYTRLDAALVRPGRLQKRIAVLPPQTRDELVEVFRYYLGPDLAEIDVAALAQMALGATPARVEGWIIEAHGTARSAGRAVTEADLFEQVIPPDDRRPADVMAIAIHEVGHALVAARLGHHVEMVSIVPQGHAGGFVRSSLPTSVVTFAELQDVATVFLAGRAADIVFNGGANTGAEADLKSATELLTGAYERQGLGESLVHTPMAPRADAKTMIRVEHDLQQLLDRAIRMLEAERRVVMKLANRLVKKKVLSGAEVVTILQVDTSNRSNIQASAEAHDLDSALAEL